jgi:hypothetical protein
MPLPKYTGVVHQERRFFIALEGENHLPGRVISGEFSDRDSARDVLKWLRRSNPTARVYGRFVQTTAEDA